MTDTLEQAPRVTSPPLEALYESGFPTVARWVARQGGSFADAQDIFQDALIIYCEQRTKGLALRTSAEAYLMGIAKHLWLRQTRQARNTISLTDAEYSLEIPDDYFPSVQTSALMTFLATVGERCLKLLSAFYLEETGISRIATAFGFRSEHSASVQKYKCLEKLRETVRQNPHLYESLVD